MRSVMETPPLLPFFPPLGGMPIEPNRAIDEPDSREPDHRRQGKLPLQSSFREGGS